MILSGSSRFSLRSHCENRADPPPLNVRGRRILITLSYSAERASFLDATGSPKPARGFGSSFLPFFNNRTTLRSALGQLRCGCARFAVTL